MEREDIDSWLWLNGIYTSNAIATAMTKHKYPKEPFLAHSQENDEKKMQELMLAKLEVMAANFENERKKQEQKKQEQNVEES